MFIAVYLLFRPSNDHFNHADQCSFLVAMELMLLNIVFHLSHLKGPFNLSNLYAYLIFIYLFLGCIVLLNI